MFLYLWTEDQRNKGYNEIASAVFNRLNNTRFSENIKTFRLICDGCGGAQNKYSAMVAMCTYWLNNCAPIHIKEIQIIFPVPGYSYIPPNRVFALLEKRIKSKNKKSQSSRFYKPTGQWHFEFNKSKRFILTKYVRGNNYKSDLSKECSVLKKRLQNSNGFTGLLF